ncbi:hypothetical protein [Mycobacterium sp.]
MTSQLTQERSTPLPSTTGETEERIFVQPWFVLAMLCMVAIVVLAVHG